MAAKEETVVTVEGKELKLSNLKKVLYPASGYTKAEVIDYYRQIGPCILPHLRNRPVTLKRFPEGVEKDFFYEKNCPVYRPEWVETSGSKSPGSKNYCLINDLPSLIWIQNLASLEIHTLLAAAENTDRPTMIVFDLDPGEPAGILECAEIALIMRDMLTGLGLRSFPKTSGGKGIHFYIPLNTDVNYEQTKFFAKTVAQVMERHYPDKVVSKMTKTLRKGKVFIDWSQNTRHKTTACVYSLRAREYPSVSMPVAWEDLENVIKTGDPEQLHYPPHRTLRFVEENGDIFREVLDLKQTLSGVLGEQDTFSATSAVEAGESL